MVYTYLIQHQSAVPIVRTVVLSLTESSIISFILIEMTTVIRRASHLKYSFGAFHSGFLGHRSNTVNGVKHKAMLANDGTKPNYQMSDTKNKHLLMERRSATFNVEELTQSMFGGPGNYFEINTRREISSV